MVCYLFVGSWLFSSIFSYLGGEHLVKDFVLGLNLNTLTFLLLAQLIIFILGWPLEWSEIIIIFVPIFLPLLPLFGVDPHSKPAWRRWRSSITRRIAAIPPWTTRSRGAVPRRRPQAHGCA
jgi:hypothetical protein